MTNLLDHIKTATDIAEKADTAVTMYPYQVRYLIDLAENKHNIGTPFFWKQPEGYPPEQCADEGWYQLTESGLVYLGKTALKLSDIDEASAAMLEQVEDKLQRILAWCDAYPLDVFPEPDFKRAHELLTAGGMTIDAISASNMRHVLDGIKEIINGDYGDAGIRAPAGGKASR